MKKILIIAAITIINTSYTLDPIIFPALMSGGYYVFNGMRELSADEKATYNTPEKLVQDFCTENLAATAAKSVLENFPKTSIASLNSVIGGIKSYNSRFFPIFVAVRLVNRANVFNSLLKKGTGTMCGVEKSILGANVISNKLTLLHTKYQQTPKIVQVIANVACEGALTAVIAKGVQSLVK